MRKILFTLWHAYLGATSTFVMVAITNQVGWQMFLKPIPSAIAVFIIGCLTGYHHGKRD